MKKILLLLSQLAPEYLKLMQLHFRQLPPYETEACFIIIPNHAEDIHRALIKLFNLEEDFSTGVIYDADEYTHGPKFEEDRVCICIEYKPYRIDMKMARYIINDLEDEVEFTGQEFLGYTSMIVEKSISEAARLLVESGIEIVKNTEDEIIRIKAVVDFNTKK